jgi:hypothetical protein
MHATFHLTFTPPVARLSIAGELDLGDHWRLRTCFADLLDHVALDPRFGRGGVVQLDAGRVELVNGSCLHLLDSLRREVLAEGQRFEIPSASFAFRRTCRMAEFEGLTRSMTHETHRRPARRLHPVRSGS